MERIAKVVITTTILAAVGLFLGACSNSGGSDNKDNMIAATVNGKNIMLAEVEQEINRQMQGQQSALSSLQLAQARLTVLEGLIQTEVLLQRAEKENLKPTEDEITQFITARKQQGGMTDDEFQRQLKAQGQSEQSVREEARKLLAIQKLQNKYMGSVSISDREVEDYYSKNKQEFSIGRGVELADIVADPLNNGVQDDAKTDAEAKLKIDNIYQQLRSADFAEIARQRSEDQSAARGGDIGFATEDDLKRNGFPPALIASFFGSMQVGDYSPPVEFNGKWYVFKLKRKQLETENRTLESQGVRQEITEALRSQRQKLLNVALLEVAIREAKIKNNLAESMLTNPSNLGLRPAAPGTVPGTTATPAGAATPQSTATPATNASPASSPKAQQ